MIKIIIVNYFIANDSRKLLWKDGKAMSERHPSQFQRGAGRTDISVYYRGQQTSGSISLDIQNGGN